MLNSSRYIRSFLIDFNFQVNVKLGIFYNIDTFSNKQMNWMTLRCKFYQRRWLSYSSYFPWWWFFFNHQLVDNQQYWHWKKKHSNTFLLFFCSWGKKLLFVSRKILWVIFTPLLGAVLFSQKVLLLVHLRTFFFWEKRVLLKWIRCPLFMSKVSLQI